MKISRHAFTLLAALMLASMAPKLHAQVRVAVVDLQRALNETEDGRRAKTQLKRLFKSRQKALDDKQNELKKMKEDIEKQKNVLSQPALQKKLEAYQQAFVELQTVYVDYQRELASKEAELTKVIIERMESILRHLGQTEGYTLILERGEAGVMWVPSNLDVTDTVIQHYNAGEGREGEAAGGGGGAARPPAGATKRPATKRR